MTGNAAVALTKPAFRKIKWLERDIAVERRPDGVIVLKSRIPLQHVIPGWSKGPDPESRDSGFALRTPRNDDFILILNPSNTP